MLSVGTHTGALTLHSSVRTKLAPVVQRYVGGCEITRSPTSRDCNTNQTDAITQGSISAGSKLHNVNFIQSLFQQMHTQNK